MSINDSLNWISKVILISTLEFLESENMQIAFKDSEIINYYFLL